MRYPVSKSYGDWPATNRFWANYIDGRNPNKLYRKRHYMLTFSNPEALVDSIKTGEGLWGKASNDNSWHYAYSDRQLCIFVDQLDQCDELWTMLNLTRKVEQETQ